MADTTSLAAIAELLPAEHRERFLFTVARLQNVPEDDEYLLVLEAVGFMTLLWKDMPTRLNELLRQAQQVRHTLEADSAKLLATELASELVQELPTVQDLKAFTRELKEQRRTHPSPAASAPPSSVWMGISIGVAVALMLVATGLYLGYRCFQRRYEKQVAAVESTLVQAERLVKGLAYVPGSTLTVYEGLDEELQRPVCAIVLEGPVVDAFQDQQGRGVIRLATTPRS